MIRNIVRLLVGAAVVGSLGHAGRLVRPFCFLTTTGETLLSECCWLCWSLCMSWHG